MMTTTIKEHEKYIAERAARDPEYAAEMEALRPLIELRRVLIQARLDAGLTQSQLAEKLGTAQPAIARLEAGRMKPSFDLLMRYAAALNVRFEILPSEIHIWPLQPAA